VSVFLEIKSCRIRDKDKTLDCPHFGSILSEGFSLSWACFLKGETFDAIDIETVFEINSIPIWCPLREN